ncbi:MAG: hypothetical protein QOI66_2668, partial [Myxococcales bacterium]|nr:hypothetical protein [Myxococcales bacterium]
MKRRGTDKEGVPQRDKDTLRDVSPVIGVSEPQART